MTVLALLYGRVLIPSSVWLVDGLDVFVVKNLVVSVSELME